LRPIRKGDRGAAVEDVQRRLIALGADLGRAGVDGVFLGATYSAVSAFQHDHDLDEDGEVGPHTWAALVDATFTLGDRLLYLRFPYLHGADARSLQQALNALGFACGDADGIFGTFTERAVRDFQANTGLAPDGIVGPDTVRTLEGLRHVWSDKSHPVPAELRAAPARSAGVLRTAIVVLSSRPATAAVADRVVNLALASEPAARVTHGAPGTAVAGALVIELVDGAVGDRPCVDGSARGDALTRLLASAIPWAVGESLPVTVVVSDPPVDEHAVQALAVSLLDGVCLGLAGSTAAVLT
jgi:peptidoglycan hydrolase-like protein with peptidoglycan-binding domain